MSAWCCKTQPVNNPFTNNLVNMTQIDYSRHYAIVGSALDLKRGFLYYTKCTSGPCLWRDDTTGKCLESVVLPGACAEWALRRYNWRTEAPPVTLWQGSTHDFPGPSRFLKDSFTMTLDPHRQIIYFFTQHLNKDGYGYIVSVSPATCFVSHTAEQFMTCVQAALTPFCPNVTLIRRCVENVADGCIQGRHCPP
jgi:hypothetical protein